MAWSGDSPAPYCANQGCWWWCETITIPVIDSIGDYLIFNVISDPRSLENRLKTRDQRAWDYPETICYIMKEGDMFELGMETERN